MTVTVRLFGPQARLVGREAVAVALPDTAPTCAQLRESLAEAAPALTDSLPGSRFAVNFEYIVDESASLQAEDEVALIGMVAGG
jgi:molybdopterin converting factor small subunit